MSCREEILALAQHLTLESGLDSFALEDLVNAMVRNGSSYRESTIRTHVTSLMCANAPRHHAVRYNDLERIGRGLYRMRA